MSLSKVKRAGNGRDTLYVSPRARDLHRLLSLAKEIGNQRRVDQIEQELVKEALLASALLASERAKDVAPLGDFRSWAQQRAAQLLHDNDNNWSAAVAYGLRELKPQLSGEEWETFVKIMKHRYQGGRVLDEGKVVRIHIKNIKRHIAELEKHPKGPMRERSLETARKELKDWESKVKDEDPRQREERIRIAAGGHIAPHKYEPSPGSKTCKKCDLSVWAPEHITRAADAQFKPSEKLRRLYNELEGASEDGDEELVAELSSEIDRLEWEEMKAAKVLDNLAPVGGEDPERAAALQKHEDGTTESQDKLKPVGDIQGHEIRAKLGISEEDWNKLDKTERQKKAMEATKLAKDGLKPVGDFKGFADEEREVRRKTKDTEGSNESVTSSTKKGGGSNPDPAPNGAYSGPGKGSSQGARDEEELKPVGDGTWEDNVTELTARIKRTVESARADGTVGMSKANLKQLVNTSGLRFPNANAFERAFEEAVVKAGVRGFAKDTELPTPIKTSNLVPLASGQNNEEAYGPRPVGDGSATFESLKKEHGNKYSDDVLRRAAESGREPWSIQPKAKAKDAKATLPTQTSGSAPGDHLKRAQEYEVGGDRARALDSYRAAASGYRKAGDVANEALAKDGIAACQGRFATQYDHPGFGRTKVCDSASNALRTALERTRAGEEVRIVGKTVRPGRAKDDAGGPPPVDNPKDPATTSPVPDAETGGLTNAEVSELAKLKAMRQTGVRLSEKEKTRYEKLNSVRAEDQELKPV